MKKWLILLLALLLCGCAKPNETVETQTVWVMVQSSSEHYMYLDSIPASDPYTWSTETLYAYDAKGNCVEERDYADGELCGKIKRTYDENGNVILEKDYDYSGFLPGLPDRREYTWDDRGRMVEEVIYDGWRRDCWLSAEYDDENHTSRKENSNGYIWEYTYDEYGETTLLRQTGPEGTVNLYRMDYVYDENGNALSYHHYTDGELDMYVEYTYDDQGRELRSVRYDADGKVLSTWDYTYDDESNTVTTVYTDGNYQIAFYDDNGNLIRREDHNEDGTLAALYRYNYREMEVPVQ